jgi:hypothetical protein
MKTRTTALAALLVALFALLPLTASARNQHRVAISERMLLVGPNTQAGNWAAAGAINDAGPGTATFTVTPRPHGVGRLQGTHVLTNSAGTGTITIVTNATVYPYPPPTPPRSWVKGKWRVTNATGIYAGLRGRGKVLATADFTNNEITILREGHVNR